MNLLWRITVTIHRYLGMAVGLLMLMWFASGIVMIYVPYPQLSAAQHLKVLSPIPFDACCTPGRIALADDDPVQSVQIETVLRQPVARIRPEGRPPFFAPITGGPVTPVDAAKAREIALDAAPRILGERASIAASTEINRDQWTVAEDYDFDRPLYLFSYDDADATQLYVASNSGAVVLWTTRSERLWNWLGAVPHWLYFTRLRSNGPLWSKIIIWTSIAGGFLTAVGLFLGIAQFRRSGRLSPYRGWTCWHHLAGVTFGVFALLWVISGTISMNPWGFLESEGENERALVAGEPLPWSAYRNSLAMLAANKLSGAVSVTSAEQGGKLFWLARWPDGKIVRLDSAGRPAPAAISELAQSAQIAAAGREIESQQLITDEDSYYYRGAVGDRFSLPVYRVILRDPGRTRLYFDPGTGGLIGRVDAARRGYRWLFDGLHRLDFFAVIRARPLWDAIMLLLLFGGIAVTGTGCYLAIRRIRRDLRALARPLVAPVRNAAE